jgi:uncharacterized membrane protein YphA (DoxX/SURF4 family)
MTNLGIRVYGLAAFALGVIGLIWDDFAAVWQPVPAATPERWLLAYIVAVLLIIGGIAINGRRMAVYGAALLTILYALGVLLLHVPRVIAHPDHFSPYSGVAEQLSLIAGGFIAFVALSGMDAARASLLRRIGWVTYGVCLIWFGVVHFKYLDDTASYVPAWLPLGQYFWARFTGAAHIAAGLAIISSVRAHLAAVMLTIMFAIFGILVHAPLLLNDPAHCVAGSLGGDCHLHWVMNAINLALTGAAWIVADSLRGGVGSWFAKANRND